MPANQFFWTCLLVSLLWGGSTLGRGDSSLRAGPANLSLSSLTAAEGLTGNRTRCILQDRWGEIWVGTQNGLNRFNGYEVRRYQQSAKDSLSLPDNFINALAEDAFGHLWIGTAREGLCRYDPQKDQFFRATDAHTGAPILKGITVHSFLVEQDSLLWIGSRKGLVLCVINESGEIFVKQHFQAGADSENTLVPGLIRDIVRTGPHTLYVGSYRNGISRLSFSERDTVISRIQPKSELEGSAAYDPAILHDLHLGPSGRLWIGARAGAFWIEPDQFAAKAPQIHAFVPEGVQEGHFGEVDGFATDSLGNLWIMSYLQVHRFIPEHNTLESFTQPEMGIKARGNNSLIHMMVDRENGIWLCSMEGVHYENGQIPGFQSFLPAPHAEGLVVRTIVVDKWGYSWIGTESDGLMVLDEKGSLLWEVSDQEGPLNSYFVVSLLWEEPDLLWVGQIQGGMQQFVIERSPDGRPLRLKASAPMPEYMEGRSVEDIFRDDQGQVWLATLRGLMRYDVDPELAELYSVRWGHQVCQDARGRIWLATAMGLYALDQPADTLRRFVQDAADGINLDRQIFQALLPDSEGYLWGGTPHGLYRLREGEPALLLQEAEGLPGNLIQSIVEDAEGRLWIGTQKGLCRLNPNDMQTEQFYRADGVVHTTFADRASFCDAQGRIYLGGDQGLMVFNPEEIQLPSGQPGVNWTDYSIFEERVPMAPARRADGALSLERAIRTSPPIQLRARDKSFSFSFAAPGYGYTHRIRYRYQLAGFSADWRMLPPGQRKVSFTNLDAGDYTFKVQASLDGQHWGAGSSLFLSVEPPWYKTWWAFLLYSLGVSLLIGSLFYSRIRKVSREYEAMARIEAARQAEREMVRRNSARDFHDEAGNKLTKLSLYTELTRRAVGENEQAQSYLNQIETHLSTLSTGMRDFIWVLNPENDLLLDTVQRLADFGHSLFEDTPTVFEASLGASNGEARHLDVRHKRHLLLIFKEAMHNTIKYAAAEKAVLELEYADDEVSIRYQDDGKGFDIQSVRLGNGLMNMRSRAREIGAELDFSSEEGTGTTLRVRLKTPHKGGGVFEEKA